MDPALSHPRKSSLNDHHQSNIHDAGTFEKCGALPSLACFKNSTHRGVYYCTALSSPNRWEASKVPLQTRIPHATLIGDHKALNKIS
jgi:hypothetical protein